jgi:hypothetical protein
MTDNLTLQRQRWFTASSSRRVEELAGPSGLPPQASIAGCLAFRREAEEWGASLERLGQERGRVEKLPSRIPALLEEALFEELTSALVEGGWITATGWPLTCGNCLFLTSACHGYGGTSAPGLVYLVHLHRTDPAEGKNGPPDEGASESSEAVVPDTESARTVHELAQAWKAIGRPVPEEDAALSVDPDDYPLF